MASNFDKLAALVGPALTLKIIDKLGGQFIRIRKKMDQIRQAYLEQQAFYDNPELSLRDGARRLGCTPQTLSNMRCQSKKIKS